MKHIEVPKRLRKRPFYQGLPIPYIAMIDANGKPDFRVTDEKKRRWVIASRRCQLCNEPLGRLFYFVGGTEAAKANMYFEPAAHLECLIYAMQVCPFIVGKIEHVDLDKIQAQYKNKLVRNVAGGIMIKTDDNFSAIRNPWWVIKKARDWHLIETPDGTILLVPSVCAETQPLHPETMEAKDWQLVRQQLL